jgi:hypothetical protein
MSAKRSIWFLAAVLLLVVAALGEPGTNKTIMADVNSLALAWPTNLFAANSNLLNASIGVTQSSVSNLIGATDLWKDGLARTKWQCLTWDDFYRTAGVYGTTNLGGPYVGPPWVNWSVSELNTNLVIIDGKMQSWGVDAGVGNTGYLCAELADTPSLMESWVEWDDEGTGDDESSTGVTVAIGQAPDPTWTARRMVHFQIGADSFGSSTGRVFGLVQLWKGGTNYANVSGYGFAPINVGETNHLQILYDASLPRIELYCNGELVIYSTSSELPNFIGHYVYWECIVNGVGPARYKARYDKVAAWGGRRPGPLPAYYGGTGGNSPATAREALDVPQSGSYTNLSSDALWTFPAEHGAAGTMWAEDGAGGFSAVGTSAWMRQRLYDTDDQEAAYIRLTASKTNTLTYEPAPAPPTPTLGEAPLYGATTAGRTRLMTVTSSGGLAAITTAEELQALPRVFGTVSELLSYSGTATNVLLTGYTSIGDGGGGPLHYASTGTTNYITTFPRSGGGYWERDDLTGPLNFAWTGHQQNPTDCSHALTNALRWAMTTRRGLYMPPGTYNVSNRIEMGSIGTQLANMHWFGRGALISMNAWGFTNSTFPDGISGYDAGRPLYTNMTVLYFYRPTNWVVEGLTFGCSLVTAGASNNYLLGPWYGLKFDIRSEDDKHVVVRDCTFEYMRWGAVGASSALAPNTVTGLKILNNRFIECDKNPLGTGSSIVDGLMGSYQLIGNEFIHCGNTNYQPSALAHHHCFYPAYGVGFQIIGNHILADRSDDVGNLIVIAGSVGGVVANNTMIGSSNVPKNFLEIGGFDVVVANNAATNGVIRINAWSSPANGAVAGRIKMVNNDFAINFFHGIADGHVGEVIGTANHPVELEMIGNTVRVLLPANVLAAGYTNSAWFNLVGLTNSIIEGNTFDNIPVLLSTSGGVTLRRNRINVPLWTTTKAGLNSRVLNLTSVTNAFLFENLVDVRHYDYYSIYADSSSYIRAAWGNWVNAGQTYSIGYTSDTRDSWQSFGPLPVMANTNYDTWSPFAASKHLRLSGGSAFINGLTNGLNKAGGSLILEAGIGTGSGTNAIVFRTAPRLVSGRTAQTLADRAILDADGVFKVYEGSTAGAAAMALFTNSMIWSGSGAPSSTGAVGSVYMRRDGGGATALYVNLDGNTTGWRPVMTASEYDQTVTAQGTTIASSARVTRLTSGTGYTITNTPSITAGTVGQILVLIATDATTAVTLQDATSLSGSALRLGAATRTLSAYNVLTLIYSGSDWREMSYSVNSP